VRVGRDGDGYVGAHGHVFCRWGLSVLVCLEAYRTSQLTELARIECVEQLTQESTSIEELDVLLDHVVLHQAQIPANLVAECTCEN
jgi:hypothetical protein